MSNYETIKIYSKYFLNKFRNKSFKSVGNINPDNIIIGETYDWTGKDAFHFPRLELLIHNKNGTGYVSNTSREERLTLSVACYIFRETEDFLEDDYFKLMDFVGEVEDLVNSANADRRLGNPPNNDFLMMDPYNIMDIEGELDKYIGSGIVQFSIVITKNNIT